MSELILKLFVGQPRVNRVCQKLDGIAPLAEMENNRTLQLIIMYFSLSSQVKCLQYFTLSVSRNYYCCVRLFVTLKLPPLDSETGLTGEHWLNTNLLKWQN